MNSIQIIERKLETMMRAAAVLRHRYREQFEPGFRKTQHD